MCRLGYALEKKDGHASSTTSGEAPPGCWIARAAHARWPSPRPHSANHERLGPVQGHTRYAAALGRPGQMTVALSCAQHRQRRLLVEHVELGSPMIVIQVDERCRTLVVTKTALVMRPGAWSRRLSSR